MKIVKISFLALLFSNSLYSTTIDELIESGLTNSSIIHKNRLQTELIEAKKEQSKAKKFGEIDIVGSYTHYNLPRTLAPIVPSSLSPNSSVETTEDLFTTGIQYSVPLFTGGAMDEQIKIDQLAKEMTQHRAKLSREELIYNIRSLYLSGLSMQELIVSQSEYIKRLEELKEIITQSVNFGKKAKIDILKSDNAIQEAQGKLGQIQNALKQIKSTLKAVTHSPNIDYLEPIVVNMSQATPQIDEDLDSLDRFKLQDIEIEKGNRVIAKSKASQKPQIRLNSYLGYNYDIDDSFDQEQLWQIGLNLKWNIFDFGQSNAGIEQAKISKLQAIVQKEATTEGFKKLLAVAIKKIEDATVNHQTNLSKLNLLQESQKIEEARYNAGVATLNDLLLAKSKTELTKSKLIESEYAYQNGIFYLAYLLEQGEER